MKYYIAENGQPSGPFDIDELLAHGLTVNSQVWNETLTGWTRAGDVAELQPVLASSARYEPAGETSAPQPDTVPPPLHQHAAPTQEQPQYAAPQYQQPQYQQPQQPVAPQRIALPPDTNKTMAVITLVLSLLCCFNVVSLVLAVLALIKGSSARAAWDRGETINAANKAKTARTMALVALVMLFVWPFVCFYFPFFPSLDNMWDWISPFGD